MSYLSCCHLSVSVKAHLNHEVSEFYTLLSPMLRLNSSFTVAYLEFYLSFPRIEIAIAHSMVFPFAFLELQSGEE